MSGSRSLRIAEVLLCCAVILAVGPAASREKTDQIWLKNGTFIIGEIKNLQAGMLSVGTDNMGTISIEWIAVASLKTDQYFTVTMTDGAILTGSFVPVDEDGKVIVRGVMGEDEIALIDVAAIMELEGTFRDRWGGYVDLGLNYASANNQQDLTLASMVRYTTSRYRWMVSLDATYSDRDDAERTSRENFTTSYQHSVGRRRFWMASIELVRNEELDLDLRTAFRGVHGWFLVLTPRAALALGAGGAVNRERYSGEEGEWNAEALLTGEYDLFLFEGRETTLVAGLQIYPSLTTGGRYRLEFSLSLRRKMVHDLTFSIGLDESYDSDPPREGTETSDLRVRTTLGWTF